MFTFYNFSYITNRYKHKSLLIFSYIQENTWRIISLHLFSLRPFYFFLPYGILKWRFLSFLSEDRNKKGNVQISDWTKGHHFIKIAPIENITSILNVMREWKHKENMKNSFWTKFYNNLFHLLTISSSLFHHLSTILKFHFIHFLLKYFSLFFLSVRPFSFLFILNKFSTNIYIRVCIFVAMDAS